MCKDISILAPANCVSEATQKAYKDFSANTGLLPFVPFSARNIILGQYMAQKGYTAENASTTLSIPQSNIREGIKKGLQGQDIPAGKFFDSLKALFTDSNLKKEQEKAFTEAFKEIFKEGMTIWKGTEILGVKAKDKEFLKEKGYDIEGLSPVVLIAPTEAENHIKGRMINSLACESGFRNPEKTRNGATGASGNEHEEIVEKSIDIKLTPAEITLYYKDKKAFKDFVKDLQERVIEYEKENIEIRKDIEERKKKEEEEKAKRIKEEEEKAKKIAERQKKQVEKMDKEFLLKELLSKMNKEELLKYLA